ANPRVLVGAPASPGATSLPVVRGGGPAVAYSLRWRRRRPGEPAMDQDAAVPKWADAGRGPLPFGGETLRFARCASRFASADEVEMPPELSAQKASPPRLQASTRSPSRPCTTTSHRDRQLSGLGRVEREARAWR